MKSSVTQRSETAEKCFHFSLKAKTVDGAAFMSYEKTQKLQKP